MRVISDCTYNPFFFSFFFLRYCIKKKKSTMGAYLQKPITEKESHDESHPGFEFGVSKMQGWRQAMEV